MKDSFILSHKAFEVKQGRNMEYKLIKSKRKTVELTIDDELCPIIKAPLNMPQRDIDSFFEKHRRWVQKHTEAKRIRMEKNAVSPEAELAAKQNALPYLAARTEYFAALMELKPTGIKITSAQKRFGSCSGKNSICYSWRLMLYPPEAIDYVVVHELAHIVHKNHSAKFYALVAKYLPDYKEREKLLR